MLFVLCGYWVYLPEPTGLSINTTECVKVQAVFLNCILLFESTINGPISINRPNKDDPPGPPCSQISNGAVLGLY